MRVIGLTGGVGGGKSTVRQLLQTEYHAFVIDTDSLGHEVIEPGGNGYEPVLKLLGKRILGEDGKIDRTRVAEIVFAHKEKLQALNDIIHPAVICEVERTIARHRALDDVDYIVVETALLLESGLGRVCDEIWYVYADEKIRGERLAVSRAYTKERIQEVMACQRKEAEFRQAADVVIDNSGSREETKRQVSLWLTRQKGL